MMAIDFDALVVGGGPAGTSVAYDLAHAGAKVLILERRSFPRMKPCGGALTAKALHALPFSIAPVVKNTATDFVAGREYTREVRFEWPHLIGALTVRSELDSFLLSKSLDAGVEFEKIGRIEQIDQMDDRIVVRTGERSFAGRFLVGADGASSSVRRLTGAFPGHRFGFAIEGIVENGVAADDHALTFDFGIVPRGYGWIFPKTDHFNVGVYTYDARFKLFPEQLKAYLRQRIPGAEVEHVVGHPIGMGGAAYRPSSPRLFLVGDAAGLCDPVLGEGIYYAIRSGRIAAGAIAAELSGAGSALARFERDLRALRRDLATCDEIATRFYRDLGLGFLGLVSPPARYLLMKGYSAGLPLGAIKRRFYRLPFTRVSPLDAKVAL